MSHLCAREHGQHNTLQPAHKVRFKNVYSNSSKKGVKRRDTPQTPPDKSDFIDQFSKAVQ